MAKQLIAEIPCRDSDGGSLIVCKYRVGIINPRLIEILPHFAYELGDGQSVSTEDETEFFVQSTGERLTSDLS